MRRVVEGPPVGGGVGLGQAEQQADHGRCRLVDRQATGHEGGEPDAQQVILADAPVDMRAELHPLGTVPQQCLLRDEQVTEAISRDKPGADGRALRADQCRPGRRPCPRPARRQVPRALAPPRVLVVFLLRREPLPGPRRTGRPVRRSVMVSVPPRAGSAVTATASFSMVVLAAMSCQAASAEAPRRVRRGGVRRGSDGKGAQRVAASAERGHPGGAERRASPGPASRPGAAARPRPARGPPREGEALQQAGLRRAGRPRRGSR